LEEFDKKWRFNLGEFLKKFPHSLVSQSKTGWSIGVFSRLPFETAKIDRLGGSPIPYIMAELKIQEKPFILFGAHLQDPSSETRAYIRNLQLEALGNKITEYKKPIVLLGDLNITPWSPYFKDLIKKTALQEARHGRGLYASWPTRFPVLQIPIDHCLTSREIMVHSLSLGSTIGSDHYPLSVEFSVK